MKITIFTLQLKKFGGIERFVTTLANILSGENSVTVVSLYGKKEDKTAFTINKNVKIKYLLPNLPDEISMKKILIQREFRKIIPELKRRYRINKEQKNAFIKYCSDLNTDIIITERASINSLVTKHYHGKAKKIATDHNFHQNQRKYINELLKSIKKFDYLVVGSKELYEFYKNKVGKTKCVHIPNPLAEIPEQKSELNSKNIISVGRFVKEKDFLTLIDVMKKVHEMGKAIKLYLIGDGEEKKEIEDKIKSLGLEKNVILTGSLEQKDMKKYFYDSSLYVMTSRTEAFGLVLAEAMSYGLPAIAFDRASGAREQINNLNGILVANADIDLMAKKIVELLNSKKMLQKYQKEAVSTAKKLDKLTVAKAWKKILFWC